MHRQIYMRSHYWNNSLVQISIVTKLPTWIFSVCLPSIHELVAIYLDYNCLLLFTYTTIICCYLLKLQLLAVCYNGTTKSTPLDFERVGKRPFLSDHNHKIYSVKSWKSGREKANFVVGQTTIIEYIPLDCYKGKGQFCCRSDNHHKFYSVKFLQIRKGKV